MPFQHSEEVERMTDISEIPDEEWATADCPNCGAEIRFSVQKSGDDMWGVLVLYSDKECCRMAYEIMKEQTGVVE